MHENHGPEATEPLTTSGEVAPTPSFPGTEAIEAGDDESHPALTGSPKVKSAFAMKTLSDVNAKMPSWDLRFKVAMVASFLILVAVLVMNRARGKSKAAAKKDAHAVAQVLKKTKDRVETETPSPPFAPVAAPPRDALKSSGFPELGNDFPPIPTIEKKDSTEDKAAKEELPPTPAPPTLVKKKDEPDPPELLAPKAETEATKAADKAESAAPDLSVVKHEPVTTQDAEKPGPIKEAEKLESAKPVTELPPPAEPTPELPAKPAEVETSKVPETPKPVEVKEGPTATNSAPPAAPASTPAPAPSPPAAGELNLTPTPTPPPTMETPAAALYPIPFSGPKRITSLDANPASATIPEVPPSEPRRLAPSGEPMTHVVRRGENFFSISQRYYATGRCYLALWDANKDLAKTPEDLYVGTEIRIPPPEKLRSDLVQPPRTKAAEVADATRDTQASRVSRRSDAGTLFSVNDPIDARRKPATPPPAAAPVRTSRTYVVRKENETLRSIANRELGDSTREDEILDLNRDQLDDVTGIKVGMKLKLPSDNMRK